MKADPPDKPFSSRTLSQCLAVDHPQPGVVGCFASRADRPC